MAVQLYALMVAFEYTVASTVLAGTFMYFIYSWLTKTGHNTNQQHPDAMPVEQTQESPKVYLLIQRFS